jgi:predicted ATPase/class 3 adenylate cyclase
MAELPSGTVSFLFTDLEGSTRLWEEHSDAMRPALARHDDILRRAVVDHDGWVVKTTGDGLHAVFRTARDALDAATAMQVGLGAESFGELGPLRVRVGVHTCEAEFRDGDYYGREVNRAARLMSVAHGGQIVVSLATSELVRDGSVELVDLGEHRLRDVTNVERIFQVSAPGLAREFPPLRSLDTLPGNLPRQVTTFVGREVEVEALAGLVLRSSLVTLTGVGGVGKTRLALQVAGDVAHEFPDGVWLCELAPVADPGAVWDTVAASLCVPRNPSRALAVTMLEFLGPKRLLLVLDNCEHLLDVVARLVDEIAHGCPRLAIVATSREGLALAGEHLVAVPALGVPAEDADSGAVAHSDAVHLFCDRAREAKSDFALTERNTAAVGQLCRRLDGIPLAIELAAARVRSLSPEELVARLDQRFRLLTRGSRAALERQQTLRNTIDWSYDLLSVTERDALNRLSVFAGGWDLAAAEAILSGGKFDDADAIDLLSQLVDKSLVLADEDTRGRTRYRLLETIRQYAQERLQASGDTASVRRRHADHYVAIAETAGPHLRSRDQLEWAQAVAADIDNFRAVLDWAVEMPSPEHAFRLIAPFTVSMAIGDAARDWGETASTIPGGEGHPLFPVVAAWAGQAATLRGDFEQAEARIAAAEQAQATIDASHPSVLSARAVLAFYRGDPEQARTHAEAWVEVARASADDYELAYGLLTLAGTLSLSEHDDALVTLEESLCIARDRGILSLLSIGLPLLAAFTNEQSEQLAILDEAIEVSHQVGDRWGVTHILGAKGLIAAHTGEWRTLLQTSLDLAEQKPQPDPWFIAVAFIAAGHALCELGQFEPAAVLIGRWDAMSDREAVDDWTREQLAKIDTMLLAALGEEQLAALTTRGGALELHEAVAYLRVEAGRALAAP